MDKVQVNDNIRPILDSFDGELLFQLYKMYSYSPEYYYTSLSQNGKVNLNQVLIFTNQLTKLNFK
jgi:hypothetical protein